MYSTSRPARRQARGSEGGGLGVGSAVRAWLQAARLTHTAYSQSYQYTRYNRRYILYPVFSSDARVVLLDDDSKLQ